VSLTLDFLSWVLLTAGAALGVLGGWGMHRFPDFYSRLHAAGTTDTLCTALFLLGLALQAGLSLVSVKLLLIFLFLYFTSPTASHSLAEAARLEGIEPDLKPGPEARER